jgi:hypothetical protein
LGSGAEQVVFIKIFRQGWFDKICGGALAPGLSATTLVKGMNQRALGKILAETLAWRRWLL